MVEELVYVIITLNLKVTTDVIIYNSNVQICFVIIIIHFICNTLQVEHICDMNICFRGWGSRILYLFQLNLDYSECD